MEKHGKEALETLEKVLKSEKDPKKLFYLFKVAVGNREVEMAYRTLYKSYALDPEKTAKELDKFFSKVKKEPEERKAFKSVLKLVRKVNKN